jgi:GNAT superfamily N-acetyltransferase
MLKAQNLLVRYPNLEVLYRKHTDSLSLSELKAIRRLAASIEAILIKPDDDLLPTSASEIFRHFASGNALIVRNRENNEVVGFTGYVHRLTKEHVNEYGLAEETFGMCELYCIAIDRSYQKGKIGTLIAYKLAATALEKGKNDLMSFITYQEAVVRLSRAAVGMLKEDGIEIKIRAFAGEELPMLFTFLTFANPDARDRAGKLRYTEDDIRRTEETNPRFNVDKGVLTAVNGYLAGTSSANFTLAGANLMFFSHPEEAQKTDYELRRVFGNSATLKVALRETGYSI